MRRVMEQLPFEQRVYAVWKFRDRPFDETAHPVADTEPDILLRDRRKSVFAPRQVEGAG